MQVLDWFFPRKCLHCGIEGSYICRSCFGEIDLIKKQCCPHCRKLNDDGCFCADKCARNFHFDQLIICLDYQKNSLFKKLLVQFKYRFSEELTEVLGRIMKHTMAIFSHKFRGAVPLKSELSPNREVGNAIILIPVPLDPKRLKYRGFNQSLLLAKYLRKNFNDVVIPDCLKRSAAFDQQAKLDRKHRMENLLNTISLDNSYKTSLRDKTVILIDDVATTCATLNECSRCLKEAGVKYVCGLVLARGKFDR